MALLVPGWKAHALPASRTGWDESLCHDMSQKERKGKEVRETKMEDRERESWAVLLTCARSFGYQF